MLADCHAAVLREPCARTTNTLQWWKYYFTCNRCWHYHCQTWNKYCFTAQTHCHRLRTTCVIFHTDNLKSVLVRVRMLFLMKIPELWILTQMHLYTCTFIVLCYPSICKQHFGVNSSVNDKDGVMLFRSLIPPVINLKPGRKCQCLLGHWAKN